MEAILGICMLVISPLVLAGLIGVWWLIALGRDRVATGWKRYAASRGLAFVEPTGEWPNRTPPAISWADAKGRYRVEALGAEAFAYTQVVGRPEVAVLGTFSLASGAGGSSHITGDALIDSRFSVDAEPADLATRLLNDEVKRGLVAFGIGRAGSLTYERGDVTLRWAGAEENESRLDEARALARGVVRALAVAAPAEEVREAG